MHFLIAIIAIWYGLSFANKIYHEGQRQFGIAVGIALTLAQGFSAFGYWKTGVALLAVGVVLAVASRILMIKYRQGRSPDA